MKVLYDLLSSQKSIDGTTTGGAVYGKMLFEHLIKLKPESVQLSIVCSSLELLDDYIRRLILENDIKVKYINCKEDIVTLLNNEDYDVFYTYLSEHYSKIKIPKRTKYIVTLHDARRIQLLHNIISTNFDTQRFYYGKHSFKGRIAYQILLKFPYIKFWIYKRLTNYLNLVMENVDEIVTVSNYSRDYIGFYCDLKKPISVFYPPPQNEKTSLQETEMKKYYENYVLLISADRASKNVAHAIIALERLYEKGLIEQKCIICGSLPKKVKKLIKNLDNYILLGYVSREKLESLYKYTDLFVYPTYNEGFGLPPLEALKYGIKVAASHVTSIPEVCGDSVYYFNPYDVEEMAVVILNALRDENGKSMDDYHKTVKRQYEDLDRLVYKICGVDHENSDISGR